MVALNRLEKAKAAGDDNALHTEALKLGSPVLVKHLCVLFNMCLGCGYLPKDLLQIMLCRIVSKLFESVLLTYLKIYIPVSETQFGFREGYFTDICTDVLKETVNTFCDNGSYVFMSFVDLSKVFNNVNFWKLFSELEERGVAHNVVKLLAYSYRNEELSVAWQGSTSEKFSRSSGTWLGSPLSPFLFSMYIELILKRLSSF